MASEMTFDDYKAAVEYAHHHNPRWRVGQSAFNVLMLHRPDLSEEVRGSGIDPYHNDFLLNVFYQWVKDHWDLSRLSIETGEKGNLTNEKR